MAVWMIFLACYLAFIVLFMAIPASLGFSFGIRNLYLATLYKIFEFGRRTIQSKQGIRSNVIDKKPPKPTKANLPRNRSFGTFQREFHMGDATEFCVTGVEAIIDDEVTKCFSAEELESWNLLTRTNRNYHYISVKLTIMWMLGCFVRYIILFPMRFILFLLGMFLLISSRIFIVQLPKYSFRNWLDTKCMLVSFRLLARSVSAVITFHNKKENMAQWRWYFVWQTHLTNRCADFDVR
ncbi:sn-1-glycerol-3-phosphate C16:0-DCA-CoA acyl transferase [Desmophyllum pertusum]|uniref:Sn-1-glycerol-3-phosphate C16:0-DCA-CoA acyl transferase n=1 Tax=Desmophyllum pertusum TaxID=174260 RepID=A0A9W9ZYZ6_9CNID|nr:sn-1-glycerol-3-phosphate C16:0-DCA-CoA acyl transferase [Desmophyllum pertusum]